MSSITANYNKTDKTKHIERLACVQLKAILSVKEIRILLVKNMQKTLMLLTHIQLNVFACTKIRTKRYMLI